MLIRRVVFCVSAMLVLAIAGSGLAASVVIQGDIGTPFSPFVPYPEKNLKPGWTLITPPGDRNYLDYKDDHPGGVWVYNVAGTDIDMHFDVGNHTTLSGRDRTAEFANAEPLAIDYFMGDDTITVEDGMFFFTLRNLPAGRYALKSYHNNPAMEGGFVPFHRSVVSGSVTDWVGDFDVLITGELLDTYVGTGLALFTATGSGDVLVRYIGSDEPGYAGGAQLNAFELVNLAGSPSAIRWTGSGADDSWSTPENWSTGTVPGPGDEVELSDPPQRGPVIDGDAAAGTVKGPALDSGGSQVMDIVAGTVNFGSWVQDQWGRGTGTISIGGNSNVVVGSDWELTDFGRGIINVADTAAIDINGSLKGAGGHSGRMELNIAGGFVSVAQSIKIGDDGSGIIDVGGGHLVCDSIELTARYGAATSLTAHGWGEVLVQDQILLNTYGTGGATVNVLGGLISTDRLDVGAARGSGVLNVGGGSLIVRDSLRIPASPTATGSASLDDGTVQCGALILATGGSMNLTAGVLILDGYKLAEVWDYIGAGLLTGYGKAQALIVDYDITNPGKTTVRATEDFNPRQAWNPQPYDYQPYVRPGNVNLSWNAGEDLRRGLHEVYFGTGYDDVNNANTSTPQIFRDSLRANITTYNVGALELWETYYWRIDEVSFETTKGEIWRFTTGCEPIPGDVNRDCVVNFEDFASTAETWGQKSMWP